MAICCMLVSVLFLSGCGSTPGTPTHHSKPAPQHTTSGVKFHRVRKGDTLYAVSWKAGVDYKTLAAWNGLSTPYTIYPGQKLRLRPSRKSSKKTRTPSSRKNTAPKATTKPRPKPKPKPKSKPPTQATSKAVAPVQGQSQQGAAPTPKVSKKPLPATNAKLKWMWPVRGKLLETFSSRDATRDGIKIAGRKGQKIQAAEAGQVVYVGSGLVGYGRLIIIKHNNKYLSAYGHNSRLLVKEGDVVRKGEHIADMGVAHSGRALLHFEIRKYGKPVNPISFLP